jgi:hypothetical protein
MRVNKKTAGLILIAVFVLPTTTLYNPAVSLSMANTRARALPLRATARPPTKPGPGRPPVHSETWSKVSVVLFDRQIQHLDRLATDIRGRTGKVLNRAEIIRALIDGLIDSGMDITAAASEADLRGRVARRLGSPYR